MEEDTRNYYVTCRVGCVWPESDSITWESETLRVAAGSEAEALVRFGQHLQILGYAPRDRVARVTVTPETGAETPRAA